MVLDGGAQLPGLLWTVSVDGLLMMVSNTGLLETLWAGAVFPVGAGWLVRGLTAVDKGCLLGWD